MTPDARNDAANAPPAGTGGVSFAIEAGKPLAEDLLLVGRVARPHGIRGQVVVSPETDFVEKRFQAGQILLVGPADVAAQLAG